MVMHDAIDEYQVGKIPTDEKFRERFGNPYAVIHRADIHASLVEGAKQYGHLEIITNCQIQKVEQDDAGVTITDQNGKQYHGQALIGADGLNLLCVRLMWVTQHWLQVMWFIVLLYLKASFLKT